VRPRKEGKELEARKMSDKMAAATVQSVPRVESAEGRVDAMTKKTEKTWELRRKQVARRREGGAGGVDAGWGLDSRSGEGGGRLRRGVSKLRSNSSGARCLNSSGGWNERKGIKEKDAGIAGSS
jgi:hypothetical protein